MASLSDFLLYHHHSASFIRRCRGRGRNRGERRKNSSHMNIDDPTISLPHFLFRYQSGSSSSNSSITYKVCCVSQSPLPQLRNKTQPPTTDPSHLALKGNYRKSFYYLEEAVRQGKIPPDAIFCTKLIKRLCIAGDTDRAMRVMEILEVHGKPDKYSYNTLINGLGKNGRIEAAFDTLARMRRHGCLPDAVTCNVLVNHLCQCARQGKVDLALRAMDSLLLMADDDQGDCCHLAQVTSMMLLNRAANMECAVDKALILLNHMASRGLRLDNQSYHAVLQWMRKDGDNNDDGMDLECFNLSLHGLLKQAENTIAEMVGSGHEPNNLTYEILVDMLCRKGQLQKARDLIDEMLQSGVTPTAHCCFPLVVAYCRRRWLDMATEFMNYLISRGCRMDTATYNAILAALCKRKYVSRALEVLETLQQQGCSPSTATYNALIGGLWKSNDRTRALEMVHQMLEKGIPPNAVTFDLLISYLSRDGMVDEAWMLIREMGCRGLCPTAGNYNILLLGFCKLHRIDKAIDVLAEMVEEGCNPNEITYKVLVEGLAQAGHLAEASKVAKALEDRDMLSEECLSRLNKTFPMLDLFKE